MVHAELAAHGTDSHRGACAEHSLEQQSVLGYMLGHALVLYKFIYAAWAPQLPCSTNCLLMLVKSTVAGIALRKQHFVDAVVPLYTCVHPGQWVMCENLVNALAPWSSFGTALYTCLHPGRWCHLSALQWFCAPS
jgi:hypothetical protein